MSSSNVVGIIIKCDSCGQLAAVSANCDPITKCKKCVNKDYLDLDAILGYNTTGTIDNNKRKSERLLVNEAIESSKKLKEMEAIPQKEGVERAPLLLNIAIESSNKLKETKAITLKEGVGRDTAPSLPLTELKIDHTLGTEHARWKRFQEIYPEYIDNKTIFYKVVIYQKIMKKFASNFIIPFPTQSKLGCNRVRLRCKKCHTWSLEKPCHTFISYGYSCLKCNNNNNLEKESEGEEEEESTENEEEEDDDLEEGISTNYRPGYIHGTDQKYYSVEKYSQINRDKLSKVYKNRFKVVNVFKNSNLQRLQGTLQCLFCSKKQTASIVKLLGMGVVCECKHVMSSPELISSAATILSDMPEISL